MTFPAIPDLTTQGETLAEDCLRGHLEVLRETGRALPAPCATPPGVRATTVELQILAGSASSSRC